MKSKMKRLTAIIMATAICLMIFVSCSSENSSDSSENAPSDFDAKSNVTNVGTFTTEDINGQAYTQDMFEGYDLTMVNIFTTWCSPCVNEMPDLEKLHQQMADKNVNVVGVALDVRDENGNISEDARENARLLVKETGVTYPVILPDPGYMNGRLTGIEAVPETFFVDKDGNIVGDTYSGSSNLEEWAKIVENELANLKGGK